MTGTELAAACAGRRDEPKAAGLGYGNSPPRSGGESDPYDSYRRQRADSYHELLSRSREEAPVPVSSRRRKSRFDV